MASSGDVELSVVSSRANLEDKDSSGSDSEEEDVKTNECQYDGSANRLKTKNVMRDSLQ